MKETWKDIECYEGFYQVSNYGRVRSLTRTFARSDGKVKTFQERVLKQGTNPNGYRYVNLSMGSKTYSARVHKLVAQAFLINPKSLPCINHKDEDKQNNAVGNLEWCTYQYNNTYNNKQRCRMTKILQLSKSGELIKAYESVAKAEIEVFGKRSNVSACCSGRINSCGGYVWKYA
jgi:hypothetical protein